MSLGRHSPAQLKPGVPMPKPKEATQLDQVREIMHRAYSTVIDGQDISTSALADLVAIAVPAVRPSWQDLFLSCAGVQAALTPKTVAELPVRVAALTTDLGLTLDSMTFTGLLDAAHGDVQKYGSDVAFVRLAHRLVVLTQP